MQLAVGAATAALDAGRALATLATERSQGFIDAEPYNTRTWNGMWVIPRSGSFSQGASNGAATSSHVVAAAPSANARTSAADSDDSFNAGAAPGPSGKWSSGPK